MVKDLASNNLISYLDLQSWVTVVEAVPKADKFLWSGISTWAWWSQWETYRILFDFHLWEAVFFKWISWFAAGMINWVNAKFKCLENWFRSHSNDHNNVHTFRSHLIHKIITIVPKNCRKECRKVIQRGSCSAGAPQPCPWPSLSPCPRSPRPCPAH